MSREAKCNLCSSEKYRVVYEATASLDNYPSDCTMTSPEWGLRERIVKCQGCGLIYKNPLPPVSTLVHNYINMIDEKYLEEEAGRRISARSILKELKKLKKKGRVLDIGCATGFLLDEAKKDGWKVYGVELSKWAADYTKNKFGIEVFQGSLRRANLPDRFFDAVILKDTLEHVYNPKEILIEIRRILRPDGIICLNTPNIDSLVSKLLRAKWWGIKDVHLYYFTRKTLYKLLDITGFKPVRCKFHSRTFSLRYWVERFSKYNEVIFKILNYFVRNTALRDILLRINLGDQIEVYASKSRRLRYLDELEDMEMPVVNRQAKIIAVLPAYNAAKTLRRTVKDMPKDYVNEIILVDDASNDSTVNITKELGLKVFVHAKNRGYGGNQKTCYTEALKSGGDIIIMVHPDYQYDPRVIPELVEPIKIGKADAVFGSRMMKGGALEGGMPLWKHNANIVLTALENVVLGTYLTEYHSGFRAYSANYLKSVNFMANSDSFVFDTEIIVQGLIKNMRIEEIPIRTRYFDEASTIKLWPSILYGTDILRTLFKYMLHIHGIISFRQFE